MDDGSRDHSAAVALEAGAAVLTMPEPSGPAAARNFGAAQATGRYLIFVDADCLLHHDALAQAAQAFEREPDLEAVYGSYDDRPEDPGLVSQFRNLLHHYVHQNADQAAESFWAGCGAVSRGRFIESGGFDAAQYPQGSIEDIEFGYRLRAAGARIKLLKTLQVTHLKRWTISSMLQTDLFRRAIPWSRLLLRSSDRHSELNLSTDARWSVTLVGLSAAAALSSPWLSWAAASAVAGIALIVMINWRFYAFLSQRRGGLFAARCVVLHQLHFLTSGIGFGWAWLSSRPAFIFNRRSRLLQDTQTTSH